MLKKINLLFVALICFSFAAISQSVLPNSGFENWTTNGVYETPDGWSTSNVAAHFFGANPVVNEASGSGQVHSGVFAAKLEIKGNPNNPLSTQRVIGFITTGKGVGMTTVDTGCAFTARPVYFAGWYKYSPVSGDTALFVAYLLDITSQDTIAHASFMTNQTAATYTYFSVPFNYYSANVPALAQVSFAPATLQNYHVGSVLYIDDIELTNSATAITEQTQDRFTIYPNPSTNMVTIETMLRSGFFTLTDITGKILSQGSMTSEKFTLDLSNLSSGVYFITVADNENMVMGKVVKE